MAWGLFVAFESALAFGLRRRAVSPALSMADAARVTTQSGSDVLADDHPQPRR
jgi:hypothetical protein